MSDVSAPPATVDGDEPVVVDDPGPALRCWRGLAERPLSEVAGSLFGFVVVAACVAFTLAQLSPSLLLADTTPAGGDMGAHVWGPAFLRDHLLADLRLSGWAPDWYGGFPAYTFYMVVPALLVVAVNAGPQGWAAIPGALVLVGLVAVALVHPVRSRRRLAAGAAVAVAVLGVGVPYGMALKWVTVVGLLALPVCAYVFGRLTDLRFPGPPLLAVASVVFLFQREPVGGGTGNIIGGNVASTMAGEYSFSLALALAVLYLGFLLRGLRTGRHRALCAVLLGLVGLCHVIPAIFAGIATVVAFLASPGRREDAPVDGVAVRAVRVVGGVGAVVAVALVVHALEVPGPGVAALPTRIPLPLLPDIPVGVGGIVQVGVVAVAAVVAWALGAPRYRARVRWALPVAPLGVLLTVFWAGPFVLRRPFLNDMGWEKIPTTGNQWDAVLLPASLGWAIGLAVVGVVASVALRNRAGLFLGAMAVVLVAAVIVVPAGRLWNARLLPFLWLCVLMLAAVAVTELARVAAAAVSRRPEREVQWGSAATASMATLGAWVVVALPLGVLPGSTTNDAGDTTWMGLTNYEEDRNVVRDWAEWNYSGYEAKPAYPEYHDVVQTMAAVGEERGCGRAMWEYESERLGSYGTPMSLMLLPFWTDGCIGSMEGLFFEASATTPYHFLNQRSLSTDCSCAQRDLPYGSFDVELGVDQLQLQGVRYYMAQTDGAVAAAAEEPRLTEVATSGPWHVYEVADSDLVVPLEHEPAVLTDVTHGRDWLGPATRYFNDPERWDVMYAADGPPEWQRAAVCESLATPKVGDDEEEEERFRRLDVCEAPEARPLAETEVTGIRSDEESISFRVTEVGVPVLVRASYFPNWTVSGADGPYRVAPNLMVVVPTEEEVELTYGLTVVEHGSFAVSALAGLGVAGLAVAARRRPRSLAPLGVEPVDLGRLVTRPEPTWGDRWDDWDEAESDAGAEIHPGAGSDPGAEIRPGAGSDAGAEIHPGAGSDAGAEIHPGAESDPGAEGDAGAQIHPGAESDLGAGSDAGAVRDPDAAPAGEFEGASQGDAPPPGPGSPPRP